MDACRALSSLTSVTKDGSLKHLLLWLLSHVVLLLPPWLPRLGCLCTSHLLCCHYPRQWMFVGYLSCAWHCCRGWRTAGNETDETPVLAERKGNRKPSALCVYGPRPLLQAQPPLLPETR